MDLRRLNRSVHLKLEYFRLSLNNRGDANIFVCLLAVWPQTGARALPASSQTVQHEKSSRLCRLSRFQMNPSSIPIE